MQNNLLTSMLLTAILTGICSCLAQLAANHCNNCAINKKKRITLLQTLLANFIEINKILESRREEISDNYKNTNMSNYSFQYFPIKSDYFVVSDAALLDLGCLVDENLRNEIISTQMELKGLFDSVSALSDISQRAMDIKNLRNTEDKEYVLGLANNHHQYATKIIEKIYPNVHEKTKTTICLIKEALKTES